MFSVQLQHELALHEVKLSQDSVQQDKLSVHSDNSS